jgi:hypothetical protein
MNSIGTLEEQAKNHVLQSKKKSRKGIATFELQERVSTAPMTSTRQQQRIVQRCPPEEHVNVRQPMHREGPKPAAKRQTPQELASFVLMDDCSRQSKKKFKGQQKPKAPTGPSPIAE